MDILLAERDGPLLVLTLNRPDKRNALSAALRRALLDALAKDKDDPQTRVVVLRGAGDKAFAADAGRAAGTAATRGVFAANAGRASGTAATRGVFAAGADVDELAARDTLQQRRFISPPHIYSAVVAHPKPVIAALNGHALGAGLELAMACDMRICAPGAKLGQPEINLGIIPGGGGTQRLPRLVGLGRASRMVLTGEAIDAATASAWGLVDEVADDPVARAKEIARAIAAKSPTAVRLAKEALRASEELPLRQALDREIELFTLAFQSAEAKEGISAFLAKK